MQSTPAVRTQMLRHFAGLGYSLRETMHPLRLGNHPAQLVKLARIAGIYFKDLDEVEKEVREAKRRR